MTEPTGIATSGGVTRAVLLVGRGAATRLVHRFDGRRNYPRLFPHPPLQCDKLVGVILRCF